MSDFEFKSRMEDAIRQAGESRAGHLLAIAGRYFPEMLPSGKVKTCPGCGEKDKFSIFRTKAGHWTWGCHKPSCPLSMDNIRAARHGDAIGMIMNREGIDRRAAEDKYLSIAGIPNPKQDQKPKKKSPPKPPKDKKPPPPPDPQDTPGPENPTPPAEPAPTDVHGDRENTGPDLSAAPEAPPPVIPPLKQVWGDLYSRLLLTANDREKLKRERGFTRETIESAGYRSSARENQRVIKDLIQIHPPGLLLSEGIAVKDEDTGEIKLNSQLTGWGVRDEAWTNPVLIPYFDKQGTCFFIRPHKGGLSSKQYMIRSGYEYAFRSARTRTHPYTNPLFWNRPEGWERKCVLTEGEHKAVALAQCGIPAMAVPGIQMPRNDIFAEEMFATLREAGIREIIVSYDNEDKSHKPDPEDRYDVEVYSQYACHILRNHGFLPGQCIIPDEWRENGKADWDGALRQFGSKAEAKFKAALKKPKPYFPQTEIFANDERSRIVFTKFNRLILEPQILTGGDEEEELAKLIHKAPVEWKRTLGIWDLAKLLYSTRNCYYIHQRPPKEVLLGRGRGKNKEPGLYDHATEIRADLDAVTNLHPEDLDTISALQAALAAVNLLIKGRPELLSDFTISCEYQIRTQEGTVHRLFRFKNKHGQVSELVQVPPSATSGAQKFREFATGVGNFNAKFGDKHLQMLMEDLGTFSAWREIRELEMLGRDQDTGLWIFGDAAISPEADLFRPDPPNKPDVIFPDRFDNIWYNGIGNRIDPASLSSFAHKEPPLFFHALGKQPHEVYTALKANPYLELADVAKIWIQLQADMICTFGGTEGMLIAGATAAWAMAPELLAKYHGQPGIWIHGRGGAGKTETTACLMGMWGFDRGYRTFMLTGGTTAVAIDRTLAQHCDIPLHMDEFRQDEVTKDRISSLRAPFGRQSKAKGKMDGTNKTRAVQPMTSPIVTGEGVTNDSATLSRYVSAILAADKRLGTKDQQAARFLAIQARSAQLHRIVRYILLNRRRIAALFMRNLDDFVANEEVIRSISLDRLRITYGTAHSMAHTLNSHFLEGITTARENGCESAITIPREDLTLFRDHLENLHAFTISYAKEASADVTSINFVVKFWKDVVTYCNINGSSNIRKFIWFEWCKIDPETNRITRTTATQDGESLVRCILFRGDPLYAEYEKEHRQRAKEPELTLNVIKAEMKVENYWIPAPKTHARQAHRLSFEGHGQVDVWALNFHKMSPVLQSIFAEQFEKSEADEYGDDPSPPFL